MIAFRHGVDVHDICPQVALAVVVASDLYRVLRRDCIVMKMASQNVDLRLKHVPFEERKQLASGIRSALQGAEGYQVVIDGEDPETQCLRISFNGSR